MGWTSEVRACFVRGDRLRIGFSIAGRSRVAERVWIVAEAEAEEEPAVKGCELSAGRETNTIVYCYDSQYTIPGGVPRPVSAGLFKER